MSSAIPGAVLEEPLEACDSLAGPKDIRAAEISASLLVVRKVGIALLPLPDRSWNMLQILSVNVPVLVVVVTVLFPSGVFEDFRIQLWSQKWLYHKSLMVEIP